jgi:hypothetical protein
MVDGSQEEQFNAISVHGFGRELIGDASGEVAQKKERVSKNGHAHGGLWWSWSWRGLVLGIGQWRWWRG